MTDDQANELLRNNDWAKASDARDLLQQAAHFGYCEAADEITRLRAEVAELIAAARVNLENYEFQRVKADRATAALYGVHYALKDVGWHPGRTDDLLSDIIKAKAAEVEALRSDAERYRWLRLQDWFDGPLCVVRNPKEAIKPGNDAPSRNRLDEAIDEARGK